MLISRRHVLAGTVATAMFPTGSPLAQMRERSFFGRIDITGTLPTNPADVKLVPDVLKLIPTGDYLSSMKALASLDRNPNVPRSSTGEPWNRRWKRTANPLLVQIWRDMGYANRNDCVAWCAVTLGWCLKRGGIKPPPRVESSQSYLGFGKPVTNPQRGDICVFTNYADGTHGHVTIFEQMVSGSSPLLVVGANQELSIPTNCPGNLGVNVVDERTMALKTRGHYLHKYVRPI